MSKEVRQVCVIILILFLLVFLLFLSLKSFCPKSTYEFFGYAFNSTTQTERSLYKFCEMTGFSNPNWLGSGPAPN